MFCSSKPKKDRLHVGCGPVVLDGWINIDNQPYPGIDKVLDVRDGLPYKDLRFIFAEHFLEHLSYDDGTSFLRNCRAALGDDGVLRLSTPSLDWVWMTQYHLGQWQSDAEAVRDAFWMNKAFRGWGHQFLYNYPALTEVLHDAGFANVERQEYGVSRHPELHDLERHEKYLDVPELPHIIIVEAFGRRSGGAEVLREWEADYRTAVSSK